ncbi:MAG: hypothetical protein LBM66_02485 [Bifidobacteriaceae bacterium]|jgi:FdrA protein|nr:hypothetical protein [Bifidobacteriaceae bacterium]
MSQNPAGDQPPLHVETYPHLYRDSVALMALAAGLEKLDGVAKAGAVMATPANLGILARSDMLPPDLDPAPDDLLVAVRAEGPEALAAALEQARHELLDAAPASGGPGGPAEQPPRTVAEGIAACPEDAPAGLVAVSVPGTYAAVVAQQALASGQHVFCFSDNVTLEDEVALKARAAAAGLLFMGPDCGTAQLDGVRLGFTNAVRPGPAGIVAAAGTGAQELACLIDRAGGGVSHIIGVGGRDLSDAVGGRMTLQAVDRLAADPATGVIAVVSKPPAPAVAQRLMERLAAVREQSGKPVVACLLGVDDAGGSPSVVVRDTLEGGAEAVVAALGLTLPDDELAAPRPAVPGGVLGLYTGGTLAAEAKLLLGRAGVPHEVLDLGDDQYTQGRPHPMIDPELRAEWVARAGERPDLGVILVDVVLGAGSAADPAGPLADAIAAATRAARAAGRDLRTVATVVGADADPQDPAGQIARLKAASAAVTRRNAAAVRAAIALVGGPR